ncbi:COR domain-containing protein [Micromonospora trifolii]|uniref:COR domain-containing protein n=1 Tax=Micromonospora trifolii TaxID=2911208 RepID=UPI003CEDDD89
MTQPAPQTLSADQVRRRLHGTSLDLNDRDLTEIPPEVLKIKDLESLSLSGNALRSIPPTIGNLRQLKRLYLADNNLQSLPAEIGNLAQLQILHLTGNGLKVLPPEVGTLFSLQTLTLNANKLRALPDEIGMLTNLIGLAVSHNLLEALPPRLANCRSLARLYANNNLISKIPSAFAAMIQNGLNMDLDSNPLQEPLPELFSRGIDAVVDYLRSLDDAEPHYEAKVLLVGEGNVGKSSLVAAIRSEPFVADRVTTHGIEINTLTLRHPSERWSMVIRTWDFGGQEVYRITHQFFFSQRALYLVVWNTREGQEQNEVEGWLRRIRLRVGPDAPTIVVATHADERHPELDYAQLLEAFPGMLRGNLAVDNRTNNRIVELRRAIAAEASRLPQMGQLLSPRWIRVRDHLLALAEDNAYISYTDYTKVCVSNGVQEREIVTLAQLLHDLGHIIHYSDDEGLQDIVVLKPEWLTKAIGFVLEDEQTRGSGGVLDHRRLRDIWTNTDDSFSYPERYYPYFLRLMEKFDVSYRLHDDPTRSLVAQLVPYERPELPWKIGSVPNEGERSLSLVCKLGDAAPGLVSWLTVRHHRSSTGRDWRRGLFLRHPVAAYDSTAAIELAADNVLNLEVRAPSPDLFFHVLRDSIEDLLRSRWPGLSYKLLIPCPTRSPSGHCGASFPLEGMLNFRERGREEFPCLECGNEHDVTQLLTGFPQSNGSLGPELDRVERKLSRIALDVDGIKAAAADSSDLIRRVLRVVSTEVPDCPRLFTMSRRTPPLMERIVSYKDHYRLTLWCEHSDRWHSWQAATYDVDVTKEWAAAIAPYANIVVRALRLLGPVAVAVGGATVSEQTMKDLQPDLELTKTLLASLPAHIPEQRAGDIEAQDPAKLTRAEHEASRALRSKVFELDPTRHFGGLRRAQTASGEFLWICPEHYEDYDPGLPKIPRQTAGRNS